MKKELVFPTLEVKKIKFGLQGREGDTWECEIWYKVKRVGYANEYGQGGPIRLTPYGLGPVKEFNQLREDFKKSAYYLNAIEEQKAYAAKFEREYHDPYECLEGYINDLVYEWDFNKKLSRWEKNNIVIERGKLSSHETLMMDGPVPKHEIKTTGWKGRTIEQMLATPSGTIAVKRAIEELRKEGWTILNTNLGDLLK